MSAGYDDDAARRAVIETGRRMNESGINQGTSGNVSLRNPHGFLVTPTALPYDAMAPEDVVQMGYDGSFEGRRRPSSEWRFHRDILQSRGDVEAVLHCHSSYATTLACLDRPIPAFHYMVAAAGGSTIRCAPYATFGTQALSDTALAALEGRLACLLGHHGQISLGRTLDGALALAVEVEALARLYVQALAIGEPAVLPDVEMARVLERMRAMGYGASPGAAGIGDAGPRPPDGAHSPPPPV